MPSLSKFNAIPIKIPIAFFQKWKKQSCNLYKMMKDLKKPKQYCERRVKLEATHFLILNCTTKLW